jgi:thiosulfate/3-mercaptopyruvate sulfurtransferase
MAVSARAEVLVTAGELREQLAGPHPPVLLDVRWRLGEPAGSGQARYAAGHLPGARWVDLETVLTRHTGDPRDGRHPLPDAATLTAGLAAAGVTTDGRPVVVYDEGGSFAASRAWWVLGWAGLTVRVLDGGIDAWVAACGELVTDVAEPVIEPTMQPLIEPGQRPTVTADDAAATAQRGVLVDVRAPERFRGETEPLDPAAGHIPGAINVPVAGLFTSTGALPDEATLRERLATALAAAAAGRPVVAYCGSGVSAAQAVLALASLGVTAALYPGSWSAWSNDPFRPVARGG